MYPFLSLSLSNPCVYGERPNKLFYVKDLKERDRTVTLSVRSSAASLFIKHVYHGQLSDFNPFWIISTIYQVLKLLNVVQ